MIGRARIAVFLAVLVGSQGVSSFAYAEDAKALLADGDKAAKAKDWNAAITAYEAANKATPSPEALEGLANAQYAAKKDGDAYASYDDFVKKYGAAVAPFRKTLAQTRMKELEARTGLLKIDAAEAGATVLIDDKPAGTTPVASPIRLSAGPHRVRITKDGFAPFDQAPNVSVGTTTAVAATLVAQADKGRITVKEKKGTAVRVYLDGVDMGDAPWFGDVPAGAHEIMGRGPSVLAPAQKIQVERGKTIDVELDAHASTAPIRISTADGKGAITIDGKSVGEGSFSGDIGSGPHKLRVVREGYDPYEETIELTENVPFTKSIALTINSAIETHSVVNEGRRLEGIYGGFHLKPTFQPGGMSASMQRECDARPAELVDCDKGSGIGGSIAGFIGYHFEPVGVELFLDAGYDQAKPKQTWSAPNTLPGLGSDPARTEEFTVRRAGGVAGLRVRLTLQTEKLRFSAAAGLGIAYRAMFMERVTTATANTAIQDGYGPDAQKYWAPALSFEPSFQYRLTPSMAVSLGLSVAVESPNTFSNVPTVPPDGHRTLGPVGLTTPVYELARDAQWFVGPFIGMMFGP